MNLIVLQSELWRLLFSFLSGIRKKFISKTWFFSSTNVHINLLLNIFSNTPVFITIFVYTIIK